MIIMGGNVAEDMDMIEDPVAMEMEATPITGMIIGIGEPAAVRVNGTLITVEVVDKIIHIEVDVDSGKVMTLIIVTETMGKEIQTGKELLIGVEDGIIMAEAKDTVIVAEGENGIPISSIMIQGTKKNPNFLIQIITGHHQWVINIDTQSHTDNIHIPNNTNIHLKSRQLHLSKQQMFVNCVTVKATMTINVNLLAILWPAHRKPSIKADHIATKTLTMGNGHKAKMITMTLMGNLFSSGGSRCR